MKIMKIKIRRKGWVWKEDEHKEGKDNEEKKNSVMEKKKLRRGSRKSRIRGRKGGGEEEEEEGNKGMRERRWENLIDSLKVIWNLPP